MDQREDMGTGEHEEGGERGEELWEKRMEQKGE